MRLIFLITFKGRETRVPARMRTLENNLQESVLSSYRLRPGDEKQASGWGGGGAAVPDEPLTGTKLYLLLSTFHESPAIYNVHFSMQNS